MSGPTFFPIGGRGEWRPGVNGGGSPCSRLARPGRRAGSAAAAGTQPSRSRNGRTFVQKRRSTTSNYPAGIIIAAAAAWPSLLQMSAVELEVGEVSPIYSLDVVSPTSCSSRIHFTVSSLRCMGVIRGLFLQGKAGAITKVFDIDDPVCISREQGPHAEILFHVA